MPLPQNDLYHAAWVVDDLQSAMAAFGSVGLRWASPTQRTLSIGRPGRPTETFTILVSYSCDGPLHVELIEGASGSPWEPLPEGRIHHLGWWTRDLRKSIRELEQEEHMLEAWMVGADGGPERFAYLRAPGGQLVEVVDFSIRPQLMAWMRGEKYV
jgi:hypothetical protein